MSQVFGASANTFGFICNCGFSRFVTEAEINFRCERPVTQATEDNCLFFYQQTHDGTSAGVPSVKRVNSAGVDQSDNASVTSGGDPRFGGYSTSDRFMTDQDVTPVEDAIG